MHFNIVAATILATAGGLAAAAPTSGEWTGPSVTLNFWAAADNTFWQPIPIDGKKHAVHSTLSFTYITAHVPDGVTCEAHGVDNSVTILQGDAIQVPIGPPQQQKNVVCHY